MSESRAGRTAVVLGGTQGIGRELVEVPRRQGRDGLPLGSNPRERGRRRQGDRDGNHRPRGRPLGTRVHRRRALERAVGRPLGDRRHRTRREYVVELRHRGRGPSRDPKTGRVHRRGARPAPSPHSRRRRSCCSAGSRRGVPIPDRPPCRRSTVASWGS